MKLTPKMWLEVALYSLVGLAVSGLLSLLTVLVFNDISVNDLAFGVIVWCVLSFLLGRFYTRQMHYHDRYDREDISHQNKRFTEQKIADSIRELQRLGFHRFGEIISRTKFLGEKENTAWYLIDETIPSFAAISSLGRKVAFVTYFLEGGVVSTYHNGGTHIQVGNYLVTSTGASLLEVTLKKHREYVATHKVQYGSPIDIATIPDLLLAIHEIEEIQQDKITPVQRRILLLLTAKLSLAFSLFWIVMQVVFRSDSSGEKLLITLVMWIGCLIFLRYRSDRLGKGKVKKEGEDMEDSLYLATLNYYSDSVME